jgi:hypothetical protein
MFSNRPVLADQLLVHVHDDVVVLGVDRGKTARLRENFQRLPYIAELDHSALIDRPDVGREDLDAGVPGLHCLWERGKDLRVLLAAQHQVEAVIAIAGAGPFALSCLDRGLQRHLGEAQGEIEERRRAAVERGTADLLGGALSTSSLLPGIMIGMPQWMCGSMPPGMTICPAASITRPAPTRPAARRADRDDLATLHADVGGFGTGRHHRSAATHNQIEHAPPLRCSGSRRAESLARPSHCCYPERTAGRSAVLECGSREI